MTEVMKELSQCLEKRGKRKIEKELVDYFRLSPFSVDRTSILSCVSNIIAKSIIRKLRGIHSDLKWDARAAATTEHESGWENGFEVSLSFHR